MTFTLLISQTTHPLLEIQNLLLDRAHSMFKNISLESTWRACGPPSRPAPRTFSRRNPRLEFCDLMPLVYRLVWTQSREESGWSPSKHARPLEQEKADMSPWGPHLAQHLRCRRFGTRWNRLLWNSTHKQTIRLWMRFPYEFKPKGPKGP